MLQTELFRELVNVRYKKAQSMPLFRTIQWTWFALAMIYICKSREREREREREGDYRTSSNPFLSALTHRYNMVCIACIYTQMGKVFTSFVPDTSR